MALLCLVGVSCGDGNTSIGTEPTPAPKPTPTPTPEPVKVAVTGVSLDIFDLGLEVGQQVTLIATVKPDNATDKTVSWTSSDTKVAKVSDGTVLAVAVGKATITVTTKDGGKTATCTVTVMEPKPETVAVTGVTLDKSTLNLEVGGTAKLTATVAPDNATNKNISWSSSDEAVAKVGTDGTVTAVTAGTATITVKTEDGEKTATCTVTVTAPAPVSTTVTSVALSQATMSIAVGDVAQLTATVKPDSATDKTVTWSSDNTAVATVAADGKVTGVKAGTANITATANDGSGKKATCKVTVVDAGNSAQGTGGVSSDGQDW